MQTIPEQMASATRAPIEAQLELFGSIAKATVENTGRLAQFQIEASRAAVDQSFAAWRQLMAARPQNLLALMSQAQSNLAGMFDPARSPFPFPFQQSSASPEQRPGAEREQPGQQSAAGNDETDVTANAGHESAPQAISEPHAAQPDAPRTAIAEAASRVAADGQPALPIAAAPIPEEGQASLPKVKPSETLPPAFLKQDPGHRKGIPRK